MAYLDWIEFVVVLAPAVLMLLAAVPAAGDLRKVERLWRIFNTLAVVALVFCALEWAMQILGLAAYEQITARHRLWLAANSFGVWVSLLVQLLGVAIGLFSAKHLRGEPRQPVYIASLASVLAAVHFLLLANHWAVLILSWAAIGQAMHHLLCFYPNRPFALLAAHKKKFTDRAADLLLITAAICAWSAMDSGYLDSLWKAIAEGESGLAVQLSSIFLALAVIARTALMPVHGWLTQVMEAPTPVSALLHAGVVNLGGYVLVFFAPLLGISVIARWLLVVFGMVSAIVGGWVLLTRVSQKVHLAWSTIAQMGFMLLECGLGLYQLAALHLLGHSLYKAHNFLAASTTVLYCKRKQLTGHIQYAELSLFIAPAIALVVMVAINLAVGHAPWPWWWSGVLAIAWAPLLWIPKRISVFPSVLMARVLTALGAFFLLTGAAFIVDKAPMGLSLVPAHFAGVFALLGMGLMYFGMIAFQLWPHKVVALRRWVYAGFYMDEGYTHWILKFWPTRWAGTTGARSSIVSLVTTFTFKDR